MTIVRCPYCDQHFTPHYMDVCQVCGEVCTRRGLGQPCRHDIALCTNCGNVPNRERLEDMPDKPQRGLALLEAQATINGERVDQYGNPEDSFGTIAHGMAFHPERCQDCALCAELDCPGLKVRYEPAG